ncbi:MAG: O-antigen ligase family protein [Bacteroidota bacterium]
MKERTTATSGLSHRFPSWLTPQNVAWLLLFVCIGLLNVSKATSSIATGGLAAMMLWYGLQNRLWSLGKVRWVVWAMVAIWLLAVVAIGWTSDTGRWVKDVREKLPLLVIPLALGVLPAFSRKQWMSFLWIFILSQLVLAVISLILFFANYEELMIQISYNGNVPVAGSLSHIYFGLYLVLACLMAVYLFLQPVYTFFKGEKWWALGSGIVLVVLLHVFTSRTGLLAFYATAGVLIFLYLFYTRAYKTGAIALLVIVSLPIIAVKTIPSLQTRWEVTLWDLRERNNPSRDLADLSVTMRLATWQTAWEVYAKNPLLGVGKGDLPAEMEEQFQVNGWGKRTARPMLDPHNQYLSSAASTGLMGIFILVLGFLTFLMVKKDSFLVYLLVWGLAVLMATGMLFESLLERQAGMIFWAIFALLFLKIPSSPLDKESKSHIASNWVEGEE